MRLGFRADLPSSAGGGKYPGGGAVVLLGGNVGGVGRGFGSVTGGLYGGSSVVTGVQGPQMSVY